jgi:hypothetical protein
LKTLARKLSRSLCVQIYATKLRKFVWWLTEDPERTVRIETGRFSLGDEGGASEQDDETREEVFSRCH